MLISFRVANFLLDGLVQVRAWIAGSKKNYPSVLNANEGISAGTVLFNLGVDGLGIQIVGALNMGAFGIGHITSAFNIGGEAREIKAKTEGVTA
jgi:hypothetical protein